MKTYLQNIVHFLNKPFPEEESYWSYLQVLVGISLFVCFFLYIFQPFGLSTLTSNRFWICLGFGSMTVLGAIVYEITVAQMLKGLGFYKNWIFFKWLLNNLMIMLIISLANFLFARLVLIGYIDWQFFPQMLYGTLMIGIIPFTVLGAIKMKKAEQKYQEMARGIPTPTLQAPKREEEGLQLFGIPFSQIKYIEALQNYVKVGYLNEQFQLREQTERRTMKSILKEVEGSSIVQCHRSYLVNRTAIEKVDGNAQGLLLSLSDCDKCIPVARSKISLFK